MRLPKRYEKLLERKTAFIEAAGVKLDEIIVRYQGKMLEMIMSSIIEEMDVKDGIIQDTAKNYRLISSMETVLKKFGRQREELIAKEIFTASESLAAFNNKYFSFIISEKIDKVIEAARKATDLRFGLDGGKFVRGGLLESIFSQYGVMDVKQLMSKAVSSGMGMREFIKQIGGFVVGTKEKGGISERKFKQFSFDVFMQYDATYNKKMAEEAGLKYFVYFGDLVKDSRDFCAAHIRKVFSEQEAEEWKDWTPAKGQKDNAYPEGWVIKAKNLYEVPSYMSYPGYDPLTDRGGYNCQHHLAYISAEMAKEKGRKI